MSSWWESITTNAQILVDELSAQANEATNEIVNEQRKLKQENESLQMKAVDSLPWETADESKSILSQSLMADILQLALSERNFTESPPEKIIECCNFDLQRYISQAMRLLGLDQNLAHTHAKISPKMNEEIFWKNYFSRIYYLQCKSGFLDSEDVIVQTVASFSEDNVIFKAEISPVSSATHVKSSPTENSKRTVSTKNGSTEVHVKKSAWENSSNEDISGSESVLSGSSYEVVNGSGRSGNGGVSNNEKEKVIDEDALFEAQLQAELSGTVTKQDNSDIDEDFDDLEDFNDLDGLDEDDDDDELEAQIARELANEE